VKKKSAVILLATYNGAEYLPEFLDSLVAQTYSNFTVIVRDDGSTDDTLKIIRSYSHKIEIAFIDANVRLGPAKSFFELLNQAGDNFDFYFFADQDDYWYESKIEHAVDKLSAEKKNVALYCSRLEYVDENLAHINCVGKCACGKYRYRLHPCAHLSCKTVDCRTSAWSDHYARLVVLHCQRCIW